jgi:hypothetical protein
MVEMRRTPEDYGLRVRTHPGGMTVTALNKMSHGTKQRCSWEGVLVQTAKMFHSGEDAIRNRDKVDAFLGSLGEGRRILRGRAARPPVLWSRVEGRTVASFVESLAFPPESARASGPQLAQFIRKQVSKGEPELTEWTVALLSSSKSDAVSETIAGLEVGLVQRASDELSWDLPPGSFAVKKANIQSPGNEALDFAEKLNAEWLSEIEWKQEFSQRDLEVLRRGEREGLTAEVVAIELTRAWQNSQPPRLRKPKDGADVSRANGRILRMMRRKRNGLLLIYPIAHPKPGPESFEPIIGLALSFPTSDSAESIEYIVNRVWGNDDPFRDADFEVDDE